MKLKLTKVISLSLIICCICVFTGCTDNNSQNKSKSTDDTTVSQTKEDDPIIGTWQFVKEDGTTHTLLSYVFQNETTAIMAMGNVAYCSDLKLDKNADGKNTLTAQLYYNINGTYVYEISDDGKTMNLIEDGKENGEKFVMKRVEDYKFMPEPPKNPEIDKKLTGTWKDKENTGVTYTFYENGTMENINYGVMITYAQYSAKDGKINYTYNQGTEVKGSYEYSFNGDILTIDDLEFIKQ